MLCWAVGTCWAAAAPPFSGPDETAHVLRAYTAARGELVGEDGGSRPEIIGELTRLEVPRSLGDLGEAMACFIFNERQPASCATSVEPGPGDAEYLSTAGRNPPLHHVLVGAPLNAFPRLLGLYLSRTVGAGLVAALLAGAVTVAWTRGLRATVAGLFVACTPMVWYLAGVVNPSSLEVAGAIALWTGGVAVLDDWRRGGRAGAGALAVVVAGGVGLAMARSLGPLWLGVVAVVLLAHALGAGTARRVLEDRRAQVAAGIVGLAAVLNTAWVLGVGALEASGTRPDTATNEAVAESLGRQLTVWRSLFANFGYLDAQPPDGVAVTWVVCGGALLLLALSAARRVERAVILGLVALALVVPVAVEASQYDDLGAVWQGRYTLPLLAGVPLLAGWALDRARHALPTAASLLGTLVVVATVAHGAAYWFAIRRYAVGVDGKVWFLQRGTWLTWKLVPVTLGGLIVIAGLGWCARWLVRALPAQQGDLLGEDAGALLEP